jgi:glycosyltransferase involved in cell wall biosynthesis
MKISVAMATYNGDRYIQKQLDSFLNQNWRPDELLICDDGSNDATIDIVREFSRSAPFEVRIYKNDTNIGHIKNFEKAISLCSGDIIFLSDQDDVWLPEKISVITNMFLNDAKKYLIQSNMTITDNSLTDLGYTKLENIVALGMKSSDFNSGCGMAIRKELAEIALPIPENRWGHDIWIGKLAHTLGISDLVEDTLMYYRRHDDNTSNWLASEPRKLSPLDSFKLHGLRKSTDGWREQQLRFLDIEKRIIEKKSHIKKLFGEESFERSLQILRQQQANLSKRIILATRPRLMRWPLVARLLLNGGYQQFSGWKSAIKDILRP